MHIFLKYIQTFILDAINHCPSLANRSKCILMSGVNLAWQLTC